MLSSYVIRQEESISRFCLTLRTGRGGKTGVRFLALRTKWPLFSLEPHLSSKSDWQTSEWVCGGQCLKNEIKQAITSRKSADRLVANEKIQDFK